MPHYSNGREAQIGDKVTHRDWQGNAHTGTVIGIQPGSETCNLTVVPVNTPTFSVTAKEATHTEDVHVTHKEPGIHIHYVDNDGVHHQALAIPPAPLKDLGPVNLTYPGPNGALQQVHSVSYWKPNGGPAAHNTYHFPHDR